MAIRMRDPREGIIERHWNALWSRVEPVMVHIPDLIWTQGSLNAERLALYAHGEVTFDEWNDRYAHIIMLDGALFLKDGHHKIMLEVCRGQHFALARVLDVSEKKPCSD